MDDILRAKAGELGSRLGLADGPQLLSERYVWLRRPVFTTQNLLEPIAIAPFAVSSGETMLSFTGPLSAMVPRP